MNSKDDFRCAIDEFDPANDDYLSWKKTAELWNTVTRVNSKQKGLALCSRLKGRAKAIAEDLENEDDDITDDDGSEDDVIEDMMEEPIEEDITGGIEDVGEAEPATDYEE